MTVDAPTEVVELPMGDITADSRSSAPPDQASATTLPISPAAHHDLKGRAVLPSSPLAHTETAHSDEAPTEAYVGLDGPSVGSPSRGGPDDKTDVMEGAAIPLPPPRDRVRRTTNGEVQHQAAIDDSARHAGLDGLLADCPPGRWLPLREAVRALGSIESLYGIARDGTLKLREEAQHGVEVWVADRGCVEDDPTQPLAVPTAVDATISGAPQSSEASPQIGDFLAFIAESHERSLQLARENGALSERVPALERELEAARESATSHQQALDAMRERMGDVIEINLALTGLLEHPSPHGEPWPAAPAGRKRWPWLLMLTICIMSSPIIAWLIGWGHLLRG